MEEVKSDAPHLGLGKDITNLLETYIDLAKVNITQKTANIAAISISGFVMAFLALLFTLFGGAALAFWLGELLNSMAAGFLIVAGLFALLLVLMIAFREKLFYPIIRNSIVRSAYD